jgi:hypothetical protein
MWEALKGALAHLGKVSPGYTVAAVSLYALSLVIGGLRWQVILRGMGHEVRLREAVLTNLTSIFVNNITPGRVGGEVFRVAMLRQRAGIDVATLTVSLGYDRLADLVPVAVMIVLSLPTLRQVLSGARSVLMGVAVLALVLALVIWALRRARSSAAWLARWRERFSTFQVGRTAMAWAVVWAVCIWAMDLGRLLIVAAAFGVSISPLQAITLSVVAVLGGLLPTIGGLGAIEGGLTAALVLYGVSLEQALAITLLERAISYALATLVGGVTLLLLGGGKLWRLTRQAG